MRVGSLYQSASTGADPRFHDRGVKIFIGGFDLLILPEYLFIFLILLKILHENELVLAHGGNPPGSATAVIDILDLTVYG